MEWRAQFCVLAADYELADHQQVHLMVVNEEG